MLKTITKYRGCAFPLLAIVGLLLVLWLLATIVGFDDNTALPKPALQTLGDAYPEDIELSDAILVTETGMKWLMFAYFYWLVALATIGFCWHALRGTFAHSPKVERRVVMAIFFAVIGVVIAVCIYLAAWQHKPLMSFAFLLDNVEAIDPGLLNLATYNMALAYASIAAILITISLLLVPDSHHTDSASQIRAITQVMYCAALFLVVWIAQATEMYRLAAALLVPEERELALAFVPTISLVAGVFASLLLGAAYLSAYLYLQSYFRRYRLHDHSGEINVHPHSPKQFMLTHWPKIAGVLMPVLPGIIGQVFQNVGQAI